MLKTLLTILAVIAACIAVYGTGIVIGMKTAEAGESWRMEVYYSMTDETQCAHFVFDTEAACNRTKLWYEEASAWHGKNKYQCILESQCS